MKRVAQIVMCCLLVQCAFARSGGGGHSGGGGGMRSGGGHASASIHSGGGFVGSRGGFGRPGFAGGFGFRRPFYGGFGFGLGFGAYAPWYYGGYYSGYYDPYYYNYNSYYYPQTYVDPGPSMVYQNPNYAPDPPVRPMIRDYPENAPATRAPGEPVVYLIAFQDGSIQAVLAYWVDGNTLHYVSTRREQREAPLESVDRALSQRLNRERRLELHLP